jgi:hypothetical protein
MSGATRERRTAHSHPNPERDPNMPRRKTARAVRSHVADGQSTQAGNEQGSEPTRRLNVLISESAFEALMVHMVRLRKPLGLLVTESIQATLTEFHIHSNPKRGRGVEESAFAESDDNDDRQDLYSPVIKSEAEAA